MSPCVLILMGLDLGYNMYKNIAPYTVVWLANRENPVIDSLASLKISGDGNLKLVDGNEVTLWSSNVSIQSNSSEAVLLDDGNLVLRDGLSEQELWQSFEHPSNTLLPNAGLGYDLETDNSKYQDVKDVNECGQWCLNNCSCKAYAYVKGIWCLLWSDDLMDVQKFSSGGEELFIHLASSELVSFWAHLLLISIKVAIKMKTFLRSNDVSKSVERGFNPPWLLQNPSLAQIKNHADYVAGSYKALSFMQSEVSDEIFPRIMKAETTQDAWETLKKEYERDERVKGQNMVTLKREFAMLKMKDIETVHQYSSRVMDLVNKIKLNGEDFPNAMVVEKMLVSLPDRAEDTTEGALHAKEKQHAAGHEKRQPLSRVEQGKAVVVQS
ncbi:hypothetical protein SLEP1_g55091 [Rubroshorea leprosula]|uniref:Bulb-type lectin domain-containing protein n=1 Tax=Rubroshorea leprosula TaxID=152421 RepID=A0AAV5MGI9_9ROSI|nr:hypothetical protein SLEP1_g55091 [Rubroshorea leprosula]